MKVSQEQNIEREDRIIEKEKLKSLESEITEARESEQPPYFTTFKNITGQLWQVCEDLRQSAYEEAYAEFMASPDTKLEYERIKEDEEAYAKGETKQAPHRELREAKIKANAEAHAGKARKKAVSSDPLGVAIMLKKYIRFVRIEPAVKHQIAPLYYYDPDRGYYVGNDELLKDLIQVIHPKANDRNAKDVLYIIARKTPIRPSAKEYTALGNVLLNAETGQVEPFTSLLSLGKSIPIIKSSKLSQI